jgi:O-antigen ligase
MNLPIALYIILFAIAIVAPLRWALISYLVLCTVDFKSGNSGIGLLNAAKGLVFPLYLLWRLRAYAGHRTIGLAPVAWLLFASYIAIASAWSLYPLSAVKLVGEMLGSFLICLAFMRATKGGYLTPSVFLPVTIGALAVGLLHTIFLPQWNDEPDRFSAFTPAQAYAAFLVSLYALSLCAKSVRPAIRAAVCAVIFVAVVLNGSRIWSMGLLAVTLVGVFISGARTWVKIYAMAFIVLLGVAVVGEMDSILGLLARSARSNRVAAALSAAYQGNIRSTGLGTYQFRRDLYQRTVQAIEGSSAMELVFGHGTSNGRLMLGHLGKIGDPNRAVHDEWLRILYEAGLAGMALWLLFIGSVIFFAYQGVRKDDRGFSRPLLAYMPAFLAGLSTENILAGAGHAANMGLLLLLALASASHRSPNRYPAPVLSRRTQLHFPDAAYESSSSS